MINILNIDRLHKKKNRGALFLRRRGSAMLTPAPRIYT